MRAIAEGIKNVFIGLGILCLFFAFIGWCAGLAASGILIGSMLPFPEGVNAVIALILGFCGLALALWTSGRAYEYMTRLRPSVKK